MCGMIPSYPGSIFACAPIEEGSFRDTVPARPMLPFEYIMTTSRW